MGIVQGTHGPLGRLRLLPLTDNPDRFRPGNVVFIKEQPYTVQESQSYGQGLLVKLEGVDSLQAAQPLANEPVEVPETNVPPLPQGDYYHFQLLDLDVHDLSGAHLGKLTEVLSTGSNDVYVVTDGQQELLVPAIADVVISVDPANQSMTVDLPPGLEPRTLPPGRKAPPARRRRRPQGPPRARPS